MKAVIALGGNALIRKDQKGTVEEHLKNLDLVMTHICKLIKQGYQLVITHGNGPQVGNILFRQELSKLQVPSMPLYICGAESQGMIGYMIQDALYDKLHKEKMDLPVITLITRVVVDKRDPAFKNPTKPIGPTYKTTRDLPSEWVIKKTLKGYRRIVPSPKPKKIIEEEAIKTLCKKAIVIACGGGGVPVIKGKNGYEGIDAVIDKDLVSAKLASDIKADMLIILTDVPNVYLNYKKPKQKPLGNVSLNEIKIYYNQDHFLSGTMGPKIEASVNFLKSGGKKVIITDFNSLEKAISGKAGTIIK